MFEFTSVRERRLWLWTVVVVVGIYSTLGLARTLSDELRNRELIDGAFLWGMALIGAGILALAFKLRPGGAEIGIALGVIAVYVLVFLRMATPEERSHMIEYGVLALLIHEALAERAIQGRPVKFAGWLAIAAAALVGVVDETIQLFIPRRVFDPIDMVFNLLAAMMAVGALLALKRVRRRRLRELDDEAHP